jgi:glutamate-1-semialdehyde 2,1-aminomutase
VQERAALGLSFGAPTQIEQLARRICEVMPSIGSSAWSAPAKRPWARSAWRGFTGRDKIVKFEGCYHGLRLAAGQGGLGRPHLRRADLARRAEGWPRRRLTLSFNDSAQVEQLFAEVGAQIACIIVSRSPAT